MSQIPGHRSPSFSEDSLDDALFHYTSADGLLGILSSGELWSTAYYCTNDESETAAGRGILQPMFRQETHKMVKDADPLVTTFSNRGVDIFDYPHRFEQQIIGQTFSEICAYITCFCKAKTKEDFTHGLLSQWRAYGPDGGYALQFSRKKLSAAIEKTNKALEVVYELKDIYYDIDNPHKLEVLSHKDAFIQGYKNYLKELGAPLKELLARKTIPNPIAGLLEGPWESLLDYMIQTKNIHFAEEREVRLGLLEPTSSDKQVLPTHHFNRNGLIVPYKKTPCSDFPLLDCIDWIIIGPNPRMDARFKSIGQIVRATGLSIDVRPSHIPFIRG